jgi:hypothetical protein
VRALGLRIREEYGYGYQMGMRPQALYGIADSPVGIADYLLNHDARSLAVISRAFDGQLEGLTREDVLDKIMLTWLTHLFVSGARLYRSASRTTFLSSASKVFPSRSPSVFPDELHPAPRSWAEQTYPKLIH